VERGVLPHDELGPNRDVEDAPRRFDRHRLGEHHRQRRLDDHDQAERGRGDDEGDQPGAGPSEQPVAGLHDLFEQPSGQQQLRRGTDARRSLQRE